MRKVVLINMPFASLSLPSIALTQLKSALEDRLGDRISVEILYLNHEFAHYLGVEVCNFISDSMDALNIGLGDWCFRQAAFPELADNTQLYLRRFSSPRKEKLQEMIRLIGEKRPGLERFLDDLIDKYELDQADLVGFTSMFSQNVACFALARKIKARNKQVLTVMGGANCEAPMGREIVKNVEPIDFVFSGPALKSFPDFVQCCLNGEIEKCDSINGVFSKTNHALGPADMVFGEDLSIDLTIKPDYGTFLESIQKNFPNKLVKPIILFETSRGCWWGQKSHCTFCGLNGSSMAYRAMNPQKAIDQFNHLFSYAAQSSYFQSVDNIMPKNYPTEVLSFIEVPDQVTLFYEVKADLTEKEFEILSRSRVKRVQPGIEALATSTLKLMKKGTMVFQNLRFLKNCVLYDISPAWNLLIGFPGEDEQVYRKYVADIPLLTHLPPPSGAFPVRFDRYSPYFVRAGEYGLKLQPMDFYGLIYPFDAESLANMAYFFTDLNITADYFKNMARWIDKIRKVVSVWHARWEKRNGAPPPMLYLDDRGDSATIYDSRSEVTTEYQISSVSRDLLGFLAQPRRLEELASHLTHIPGFDTAREIAFLQDRGLIFQEGERLMSLTLPKAKPRPEQEKRDE